MKVEKITIETVRVGPAGSPSACVHENVVILWTEDGKPHTLPCIAAGKSEVGSTYLNWPIYFNAKGERLCHEHGGPPLTIEKALQIEANPAGKHRCINCGQLRPESELYRGGSDWACVDPEHCGPFRDPVREDYEELTKSFAQTLFSAFQVSAVMNQQPITPPVLHEYFAAHPVADCLLRSLVASAMWSRSRWGKSIQQRQAEDARIQFEVEKAIHDLMQGEQIRELIELRRQAGEPPE